MTTVNELKMLRMKVLSSHPWAQANIGRVVSRIRREFGVETWEAVTATMQQVRVTKDIALWQATLDPLIAKLQKADDDKKSAEKEANRLALAKELESKRQQEAAACFVTEDITRLSAKSNIVKRKRM